MTSSSKYKIESSLPKPQTGLAFDIVTHSVSHQADAEVLVNCAKVLQDCQLPVVLQISHHLLLKAVLVHCQVPEDAHSETCFEVKRKLVERYSYLFGGTLNIIQRFIPLQPYTPLMKQLLNLIDVTGSLEEVKSHLISTDVDPSHLSALSIFGSNSKAAEMANHAFNELEQIITIAKRIGLSSSIFVCLDVGLENYYTHSGFVFRFITQTDSQM